MSEHPDPGVELRMRCLDLAIRMEAGDVVAAASGLYEFATGDAPDAGYVRRVVRQELEKTLIQLQDHQRREVSP